MNGTALSAAAIWLAAGFINGVTSFGGNMVCTPAMTFLMDGKTAIIYSCLVGTAITVVLAFFYFRSIRFVELLLLTAANMAGVPIGSALLAASGPKPLLLAAGLLLLLFVAWQFVMKRLVVGFTLPMWMSVPAGILSGILLGSTSVGGAVVGIYAFLRRWDKETSLGMLNCMAAVSMLFLIFVHWKSGFYTQEILSNAPLPAAAGGVGVLLSIPVIRRIDIRLFRKLLVMMIMAAGIVLLIKGIMA